MTYNIQLDDAMETIENLLNSPKAPLIIDTIKKIKAKNNFENILLD